MSEFSWADDITDMHLKYESDIWIKKQVKEGNYENLKKFLEFRLAFIQEELTETTNAVATGDAEEIVDGLTDILVVALGTLDLFDVSANTAWKEVFKANIAKKVGVKESRPNPLGLPDLVKPEGWVAPDHTGNHGLLPLCFQKEEK